MADAKSLYRLFQQLLDGLIERALDLAYTDRVCFFAQAPGNQERCEEKRFSRSPASVYSLIP